MKHCITAILAAALLAAPAMAQDTNCENPQSQQDMNYCAHQDWKAADARLNVAYKKARAAMRRSDQNAPASLVGAEVALRDAQRAWIAFRDKACEAEGWLFRGGTMEPLIVSSCMTKLTEQRTADLELLAENM